MANYIASKIKGKSLVYDSHEYFTEVPELVGRPTVKKIWTTIEKWILPKIKYSYTVCDSLAKIYNEKYGIDMKVVRNTPSYIPERIETKKNPNFKTIIYQGVVNIRKGFGQFVIENQILLRILIVR